MTHLDADKAIALLKAQIEKRGADFNYIAEYRMAGCFYQVDGAPACLVGGVLADLGLSGDELADLDNAGGVETVFGLDFYEDEIYSLTSPSAPIVEHGIEATNEAVYVLKQAQRTQDRGAPWGEALKRAEQARYDFNDIYRNGS